MSSDSGHYVGLLDILARQAADLLERTIADEALREAQAELRALNETLEQRVAERTAMLMRAEEKLQDFVEVT
ncbi:hypothetical protein, partial [Klebsiella pneumoniae]|uniref:hypothetical protein n=1 Tax=Klebsiella pneumoniae TaxID=573 RepID=UPI0039C2EA05